MKLNLKQERENTHMKRKELKLEIEHDGEATPRKDALQQLVAKQFGFEAEKTDVRNIFSAGGAPRSEAKVFVWSEAMPKQEKKAKKETKKPAAKKEGEA